MRRGEIWWVNLRDPVGSEPGFRRPALVISSDAMNLSSIQTVLVAILTTNLRLANAPGNVLVTASETGLPKDSVVNVSQLVSADKEFLSQYAGKLDPDTMSRVTDGLRLVMVQ